MKYIPLLFGILSLAAACSVDSPTFDGGPGFDGGLGADVGALDTSTHIDAPVSDTSMYIDAPVSDVDESDSALDSSRATPVLTNFRVEDSQKSRVYFDSSEPITGTNASGFIISGKLISGVSTITNQTTGHYFTVSSAFDFWDNNTIRYSGGSDIGIHSFDLQYIENNIDEPISSIDRYVSASANGSGNGTSSASPWTMAQAMSNASSGMTINILNGNYGSTPHSLSGNGTPAAPIRLVGYNETDGVGVKPNYTWTHDGSVGPGGGTPFDSSKMPLFDRGGASGVFLNFSGNNVIIKNIMIDNSDMGLYTNGANIHIENVYSSNTIHGGDNFFGPSDANTNIRLIDSVAYNGGTTLVRIYGNHLLFENNTIIDDENGVDYYLSSRGDDSIFRNNYLERLGFGHGGHGITIKAEATAPNAVICEYNLVEINEIYGIDLPLEARKAGVQYNVFRDIYMAKNATRDKVKGIVIMAGAAYNIFDRIDVHDGTYGISFVNSGNVGNVIRNSNFSGVSFGVAFVYQRESFTDSDNLIINCNFYDIGGRGSNLFMSGSGQTSNNSFINNNVHTVERLGSIVEWSLTSNNFYDSGMDFDALVGSNDNINANPFWTDESDLDFTLSASTPASVSEGGVFNSDVRYDASGSERTDPISIGAYEQD